MSTKAFKDLLQEKAKVAGWTEEQIKHAADLVYTVLAEEVTIDEVVEHIQEGEEN